MPILINNMLLLILTLFWMKERGGFVAFKFFTFKHITSLHFIYILTYEYKCLLHASALCKHNHYHVLINLLCNNSYNATQEFH